jgi:hypothetical protein
MPASVEYAVCKWVSPKNTRLGKVCPTLGEYSVAAKAPMEQPAKAIAIEILILLLLNS